MLALAVGSSGCSVPTGFGAVTVGATEERESAALYIWSKRGADAGELARVYCLWGGPRERAAMVDAFRRHALPAVVSITCDHDIAK